MAKSWLPLVDNELLSFSLNYSTVVAAGPVALGLTLADSTELTNLTNAYQTALTTATTPSTRTPSSIIAKDVAKASLVAEIRGTAKRIQANPLVTPEQKSDLGLPIHKTTPTPIPAPVTRPVLSVVGGSVNKSLTIHLVDETTPTKKAKPFGVDGAEVYSYVPKDGEAPPDDLDQWTFEGIAKRATYQVDFPAAAVNKVGYVRALWFNPRGEPGPASNPISATIAA